MPQLLSLCSTTREAAIVRGPRTAMKSGPRLPQLEKALTQKRRPNTAKNKTNKKTNYTTLRYHFHFLDGQKSKSWTNILGKSLIHGSYTSGRSVKWKKKKCHGDQLGNIYQNNIFNKITLLFDSAISLLEMYWETYLHMRKQYVYKLFIKASFLMAKDWKQLKWC